MSLKCKFKGHRMRYQTMWDPDQEIGYIIRYCTRCNKSTHEHRVFDMEGAEQSCAANNADMDEIERISANKFNPNLEFWMSIFDAVILILNMRLIPRGICYLMDGDLAGGWISLIFGTLVCAYWLWDYTRHMARFEKSVIPFEPVEEILKPVSADQFYDALQSKPKWYEWKGMICYAMFWRRQKSHRV